MKVTNLDCLVCDPSFDVFRVTDLNAGGLISDNPPHDASEFKFEVWDCEGSVITVPLPWFDCVWIARALNTQSDSE